MCTILLVTLLVPSLTLAQPSTQPSRATFTTVLRRDFPTWDANGDGVLSETEIDKLVIDPSITGDDAAVAASLKIIVRSGKYALPNLDAAYFDRYERAAAKYRASRPRRGQGSSTQPSTAPASDRNGVPADVASILENNGPTTAPSTTAIARPSPDWDLMFTACKRRIARKNAPNGGGKPGPIWPENGLSLRNMRQGPLGDCYFVSVVGAIVNRDHAHVEQLVEPLEDGKFRVTFPTTQPITVTVGPLTDAQIAMSSSTAGEGLWLAVLEQAFGKYRAVVAPSTRETSEATDLIARGGSTAPTITALTGHVADRMPLAGTPARRESRKAETLPKLRTRLVAAMRDRRLVTTGVSAPSTQPTQSQNRQSTSPSNPSTNPATRPSFPVPPGINTKHAYAVLSYDAETDTLELWNPHGQQFKPKGEPGIANGYPTDHGVFKLPLVDAYQFVASFTFETDQPAPATQPANRR